jgi:hypothetical protein
MSAFFLCCVVLCRYRPCVRLIPRPRSPTKCPNRFISSEVKLLNRNRPLAYILKEDDDDDYTDRFIIVYIYFWVIHRRLFGKFHRRGVR